AKEIPHVVALRLVIMRIDVQSNLDFLQLRCVLVLARLTLPLLLLILVFAEIDDPANWRRCVGRYFDQVHPALLGNRQRLAGRDDPELLSVCVYDPYFTRANLLINTNKRLNCYDLLLTLCGPRHAIARRRPRVGGLISLNDLAHNSLYKRVQRYKRP